MINNLLTMNGFITENEAYMKEANLMTGNISIVNNNWKTIIIQNKIHGSQNKWVNKNSCENILHQVFTQFPLPGEESRDQ